jgi:hypothetical protein
MSVSVGERQALEVRHASRVRDLLLAGMLAAAATDPH